jgi:predicted ATP-grasp superfamily ATP-dependent carboligase
MRSIFVVLVCVSVSACVTIESPDNLISDTIKAGKEVYQDIKKGKKDEDEEQGVKVEPADTSIIVAPEMDKKLNTFTNTYPLTDTNNELGAMQSCMAELVENTRKTLNRYTLQIVSKSYETINVDNKDVIQCGITLDLN